MKLLSILLLAALSGFVSNASAQTVIGLSPSGLSLVTFNIASPGTLTSPLTISGAFNGGEIITAIDFRPSNQALYGYSSGNRLFTINTGTGAATLVANFPAAINAANGGVGGTGSDATSTFPPTGAVSIDVNPAADSSNGALRIIDTNGNNLRFIFNTGALAGDDTLSPGTPFIVGAAYTNNDTNTGTGTTLYVIDAGTDSLYTQNPPNDGVLTLVGSLTIGDVPTSNVGFDVPLNGTTNAYAAINDNLYTINLTNGLAVLAGQIGGAGTDVRDIAIVPEPSCVLLVAAGASVLALRRRRRDFGF